MGNSHCTEVCSQEPELDRQGHKKMKIADVEELEKDRVNKWLPFQDLMKRDRSGMLQVLGCQDIGVVSHAEIREDEELGLSSTFYNNRVKIKKFRERRDGPKSSDGPSYSTSIASLRKFDKGMCTDYKRGVSSGMSTRSHSKESIRDPFFKGEIDILEPKSPLLISACSERPSVDIIPASGKRSLYYNDVGGSDDDDL